MLQSPRALAWRAGAVLVGIVTALVVTGDLRALHAHAHDLGRPRSVVVAHRDLPLGHLVARDDVDVVVRYSSQVPRGALRRLGDVAGRFVRFAVAAGVPVVAANVVSAGAPLGAAIPEGFRIVRIPDPQGLDPAPGSVIDVVATARDGADAGLAGRVVAGAIVVGGAGRGPSDGSTRAGIDGSGVAQSGTGDTVAVLLPERDVSAVASALARGQVMLALAPPEEACCPAP